MFDDDELTAKMIDLYQHEGLTLREIGERFRVSKQAVHYRLRRVGIQLRPKNEPRLIDRKTLVRLHHDEGLPVYKIAAKLQSAHKTVLKEMERHGVKVRSIRLSVRRYPELNGLAIGQSVEVPRRNLKKPHVTYYSAASLRGIRVSVQIIGTDLLRITRKA